MHCHASQLRGQAQGLQQSVKSSRTAALLPRCHRRPRRWRATQPPAAAAGVAAAAAPPAEAAVAEGQPAGAQEAAFDWRQHWFPVVLVSDADKAKPYPFTLLNEPIVLWFDPGAERWRCFSDVCPHRLVPLSEGRISASGRLQCPYHGWEFGGDGACAAMPQGGDPAAPRACATAFQCTEAQGLVWVRLQAPPADGSGVSPDAPPLPLLPELDDPSWTTFGDMWRDMPYDYSTLIENVIDVGHVPFTHHASVSRRESSSDFSDMRVTERGPWGFRGEWPSGPRRGRLGPQRTLYSAPALMRHTIDAFASQGFANITAVWGTPTTPGRCRAFVRQPFRFRNRLLPLLARLVPSFRGHLGALDVLDEDNIFLHRQERELVARNVAAAPLGRVYHMPSPSDAYVAAFRTWLQQTAGGGPLGPMDAAWLAAAGPRLSRDALLDHWHSHCEGCAVCAPARRRLRALQAAAAAAAGLATLAATACAGAWLAIGGSSLAVGATAAAAEIQATVFCVTAWSAGVAGIAALVWGYCRRLLPRFHRGAHTPARNRTSGECAPT